MLLIMAVAVWLIAFTLVVGIVSAATTPFGGFIMACAIVGFTIDILVREEK
jgi:hypothetical protein